MGNAQSSTTQTFNISFPKALVKQIDAKAAEQFGSRSDFLRAAAIAYLKNEQEWEALFRYGKAIRTQTEPLSAETVADTINKQRRSGERWFNG